MATPGKNPQHKEESELQELLQYLDASLGDYERYVSQIGTLKYTAPQFLYYREEVQDMLEMRMCVKCVDLKSR